MNNPSRNLITPQNYASNPNTNNSFSGMTLRSGANTNIFATPSTTPTNMFASNLNSKNLFQPQQTQGLTSNNMTSNNMASNIMSSNNLNSNNLMFNPQNKPNDIFPGF